MICSLIIEIQARSYGVKGSEISTVEVWLHAMVVSILIDNVYQKNYRNSKKNIRKTRNSRKF